MLSSSSRFPEYPVTACTMASTESACRTVRLECEFMNMVMR